MQPKIAVVEDEEALSVLLRYNLEAEGYEVETILRGDEAEIRLQERVPDLLILDWMLPGVSGATWLGIPPGKLNCLKSRCIPSSSWLMFGYTSLYVPSRYAWATSDGPPWPGPMMYIMFKSSRLMTRFRCTHSIFRPGDVPQ